MMTRSLLLILLWPPDAYAICRDNVAAMQLSMCELTFLIIFFIVIVVGVGKWYLAEEKDTYLYKVVYLSRAVLYCLLLWAKNFISGSMEIISIFAGVIISVAIALIELLL